MVLSFPWQLPFWAHGLSALAGLIKGVSQSSAAGCRERAAERLWEEEGLIHLGGSQGCGDPHPGGSAHMCVSHFMTWSVPFSISGYLSLLFPAASRHTPACPAWGLCSLWSLDALPDAESCMESWMWPGSQWGAHRHQGPCSQGKRPLRGPYEDTRTGTSLVAQWLRLWVSNAGDSNLIPGQGTKITYAVQLKIILINIIF